jgi:hypothetical protein
MPEVVATQLWLAPLFGTLCGTSAMAIPEKANSNAVVIAAVAHALGPFLLVMSLLVALRARPPQLTCRVEDPDYRRAVQSFDGRVTSSLDASRGFLWDGSMFATKTAENPVHSYESEPSPRGFQVGAQPCSRHLWRVAFGSMAVILGGMIHWSQKRTGTLPAFLGRSLLAPGAVAVFLMPVSGFWVVLPQAVMMILVARRGASRAAVLGPVRVGRTRGA